MKINFLCLLFFTTLFKLHGQTVNFSNGINNLVFAKTTIKETLELLGNADSTFIKTTEFGANMDQLRIDSVLVYNSLKISLSFRQDYGFNNTLSDIDINSTSPLTLNDSIFVGKSTKNDIVKMFGKPKNDILQGSHLNRYKIISKQGHTLALGFHFSSDDTLIGIWQNVISISKTPFLSPSIEEQAIKGLKIIENYCPSGFDIVRRVKKSKHDFIISGYQISVSASGMFESYFTEEGVFGLLSGISTGVHESVHALDYLRSYALLEKEKNVKIKKLGYYQGIHIKSNEFYLMEIKCTIPSNVIHGQLPKEFESSNRYKKYIYPATKTGSTIIYGIYGLLDEWNAYYHELRTSLNLSAYVKTELEQSATNWSFYYVNFYQSFSAYYEFKIFILEYLFYLKKNEKKYYKKIVRSEEFKAAFLSIQKNYSELIYDWNLFKQENFQYLNSINIQVIENENELNIGSLSIKTRSKDNINYGNYISTGKFQGILEEIES